MTAKHPHKCPGCGAHVEDAFWHCANCRANGSMKPGKSGQRNSKYNGKPRRPKFAMPPRTEPLHFCPHCGRPGIVANGSKPACRLCGIEYDSEREMKAHEALYRRGARALARLREGLDVAMSPDGAVLAKRYSDLGEGEINWVLR